MCSLKEKQESRRKEGFRELSNPQVLGVAVDRDEEHSGRLAEVRLNGNQVFCVKHVNFELPIR